MAWQISAPGAEADAQAAQGESRGPWCAAVWRYQLAQCRSSVLVERHWSWCHRMFSCRWAGMHWGGDGVLHAVSAPVQHSLVPCM